MDYADFIETRLPQIGGMTLALTRPKLLFLCAGVRIALHGRTAGRSVRRPRCTGLTSCGVPERDLYGTVVCYDFVFPCIVNRCHGLAKNRIFYFFWRWLALGTHLRCAPIGDPPPSA